MRPTNLKEPLGECSLYLVPIPLALLIGGRLWVGTGQRVECQ
jgi:hypothetical protein